MKDYTTPFTKGLDTAKDEYEQWNRTRKFMDMLLDLLNMFNKQDKFDKDVSAGERQDLESMMIITSNKLD